MSAILRSAPIGSAPNFRIDEIPRPLARQHAQRLLGGRSGQVTTTKSDSATSLSSSAGSASGGRRFRRRWLPSTRMPKPLRQIFATRLPISPTPTMPAVMAAISCALLPSKRVWSHFLVLMEVWIPGKFRANTIMAITQYSATDCALPPGILATGMPRWLAAASGTRSRPVPWIVTALIFFAKSKKSSGRRLRVITASTSAASRRMPSKEASRHCSTSAFWRSSASPEGSIGSIRRTRIRALGRTRMLGKARQDTLGRIRRNGRFRQQGFREFGFEACGDAAQRVARRQAMHVGKEGEQLSPRIPALAQARALVGEQRRGAGVVEAGCCLSRMRFARRAGGLVCELGSLVQRCGQAARKQPRRAFDALVQRGQQGFEAGLAPDRPQHVEGYDVGSALPDRAEVRIAHQARVGPLLGVADAAAHLHRVAGDLARVAAGAELDERRHDADAASRRFIARV